MSILAGLPWLAAGLLASAAAMTWAVGQGRPELAGTAAALFIVPLILAAWLANRKLWRLPSDRIAAAAAPIAGTRNAALLALVYGWGAAALAGIYTLSGIRWQHGLQYAAGMAVIGIGIGLTARALASPTTVLRQPRAQHRMLQITVLHAAAAAMGLAFLFTAGKLGSAKGDWPANIVFLTGGLAVLALSVIAAVTQFRLSRRPGH